MKRATERLGSLGSLGRRRSYVSFLFLAGVGCVGGVGCGGRPPLTPEGGAPGGAAIASSADHPPVALVTRDGDPRGAFAVAVATEGIDPEEVGRVPVALAALLESRLSGFSAAGAPTFAVTPWGGGLRVAAYVGDDVDPRPLVDAVRAAFDRKVEPRELAAVEVKWGALEALRLEDPGLQDAALCRGDLVAPDLARHAATLEQVERWRAAAFALGRVAYGVVGSKALLAAVTNAAHGSRPWRASDRPLGTPPVPLERPRVFASTAEDRLTLAFHVGEAAKAAEVAKRLAGGDEPLVARLAATGTGARLARIAATAHPREGCLVVDVDFDAEVPDRAARAASVVAIAKHEIGAQLSSAHGASGLALARGADDAREAAERAAAWTLVESPAPGDGLRAATTVALAVRARSLPSPRADVPAIGAFASAFVAEIPRADASVAEALADPRIRVERGQSDVWVVIASPCGTLAETESDAGSASTFVTAAAHAAMRRGGDDVSVAPWFTAGGVGVVAHGAAKVGEPPVAHARRIADAAARSLLAEPLLPPDLSFARGVLLARAEAPPATAKALLARAAAPSHPSWLVPGGTADALTHGSDAQAASRAAALRRGPWRAAIITNVDDAQARAAVDAVDRWVPRGGGGTAGGRTCPPVSPRPSAQAGAIFLAGESPPEAWMGLPLPEDPASRRRARILAAMLDAPGGPLERVLEANGLARAHEVDVVGPESSPFLVFHVVSASGALDAALSETRSLFDRMRKGALEEADLERGVAREREQSLERRARGAGRALDLWSDALPSGGARDAPPTADAMRAFAALVLKDEALLVVAPPPRPRPGP